MTIPVCGPTLPASAASADAERAYTDHSAPKWPFRMEAARALPGSPPRDGDDQIRQHVLVSKALRLRRKLLQTARLLAGRLSRAHHSSCRVKDTNVSSHARPLQRVPERATLKPPLQAQ